MYYSIRFYLSLILILHFILLHGQNSIQDSLFNKGVTLHRQGEYQPAYNTYREVLSIVETKKNQNKNDSVRIATTYRNIGICQIESFEYEKAQKNLDVAIDKYEHILSSSQSTRKDTSRLGVCLQHKARLMKRWGEFEEAISYANKAQQKFGEIQDAHNQIRIGNVLAGIYFDLKNFKKVENIALQSIQIYRDKKLDKTNLLSDIHTILANAQVEQLKYIEAIKNHNKALEVTKHPSDSAGIYNNLGILYTKTKEYKLADVNFRQSLFIKKKNTQL